VGPAFDLEAARALFAGLIAGAIAGLATTAIALVALSRNPALRARLPMALPLPALGVVAANAMLFAWTLVGLVLGALWRGVSQPAFSIAVAVAVLALLAAAAFVRARLTWPMGITAVVAAVAFAGILPLLAGG